jgi:plasmid stability protein
MCFSVPRAGQHTAQRYKNISDSARDILRQALSGELASADEARAAVIQDALDGDNFMTMCAVRGGEPDCPATVEDDGATVTVSGDAPGDGRIAVVRLFWNAETETDLDLGQVTAGGS